MELYWSFKADVSGLGNAVLLSAQNQNLHPLPDLISQKSHSQMYQNILYVPL